jgi:hypothetical protein
MLRSIAFTLLALLSSSLAACGDPEPPIAGHWTLHRTARPAPASCASFATATLHVVLTPGGADEIDVVDEPLFDNGGNAILDESRVHFSTQATPFSNSLDPIIVAHDLTVDGDRLVGTATATGDGTNGGCTWTLDVVGEREPE